MNGSGSPDILGRSACMRLLETVVVGRVAWATGDGRALVLPVNFFLDGETVVFRSSPGDKLDAARGHGELSFEADDAEPALRTGWSVLVHGPAEIVTDAAEAARLTERSPASWLDLPHASFVRIVPREITGRRLPLHLGGVSIVRQGPWRPPDL
ncbi:pyridoxamine 5'-phosphate oxidase family protein [Actinomadura rupiterrae]|uniref:pyridoxamine 5'-phosphate oxidase family protein n=1 Tax=Actinomadura rupiterrae TaxID=559627 RepID=UPI0020A35844|nr:pyridoxamine 5'-phosphate oxidase family protein [Actinomadura rupiterrae]MCP2341405.1 nitroimidazol reductase NimA-like FMN-containing flavoprotein (pyridoxamine 5'-phosphate oxidase superfamily) [Actinomadura rupiterrae]